MVSASGCLVQVSGLYQGSVTAAWGGPGVSVTERAEAGWCWFEVPTFVSPSVLQVLHRLDGKSPLASHVSSSRPCKYESFVGDRGLSTSKVVRFLLKMRVLSFLQVDCVYAYTHTRVHI